MPLITRQKWQRSRVLCMNNTYSKWEFIYQLGYNIMSCCKRKAGQSTSIILVIHCCNVGSVLQSNMSLIWQFWLWNKPWKSEKHLCRQQRFTTQSSKSKVNISVAAYRLGDVKDDDRSLSAAVIHGSQAVVSLLSRGVPDLELHCGVV